MWLIAEAGSTAVDEALPVGWAEPNYPIAEESWRDLLEEFEPVIVSARQSKPPWTIQFITGGRLEMWTLSAQVVSRGRKYRKFIINEAGVIPGLAMRYDAEIEPTLIDYRGRMCAGSTPNVIGPDFIRWFKLGQTDGSGWKSWRWRSRDNPAVAEEAIRREESMRARGVPEWIIRQELYGEPADSDSAFFPSDLIEVHKATYGAPPVAIGRFTCDTDDPIELESIVRHKQVKRIRWEDDPFGPWKFWAWWDGHRPPQDEAIFGSCLAIDLGQGVGSSNSVISVGNADTRTKFAEFASAGVLPERMAVEAGLAGLWLGGRFGTGFVNFEVNGGTGETFAKYIQVIGYGNVHRDKRRPSDVASPDPGRIGWRSSYDAKVTLLEDYRAALSLGRFFNPSAAALDECLGYHYDKRRRLVSEQEAMIAIAADGARAPHGDRVIADALLWRTMQNTPVVQPPEMAVNPGTLAATLQRLEREREEQARRW